MPKFDMKARSPKKTRPKIGRELFNQGASTKLVSGISMPLSGLFGFFTADDADSRGYLWILSKICGESSIAKKNPAKNWSGM